VKIIYKTVFPPGDRLDEDAASRKVLSLSYCCDGAKGHYGTHLRFSRHGRPNLYVECRYDVEDGPPEYDPAPINYCPFCGQAVELVEAGRYLERLVQWPAMFSKVEEEKL